MGIKIVILLLLIYNISIVSASLVDDAAAGAVQTGMNSFFYSVGDSMINLNGNGTIDDAARQETPGTIVRMISYTVDPFSLDFVVSWWGTSLVFFVMVAIIYITAGGGFALLNTLNPSLAQRIVWLESGTSGNFEIKQWMSNVLLAMIFPLLTYFGLYTILQLSYVVTAMLTQQALTAIPPSAQNIVVYMIMAVTYLLLSIIMGIRNIVIVIFCAGGLMLAALYLIPSLQNLVKFVFNYFLLLVFMQPLMVFTAAVGVMFLSGVPIQLLPFMPSLYIALMVLLLLIGVVCVLGYGTISRLIGIAVRAAI